MSGQVSADQVEAFFDNLKAAVRGALRQQQNVTIEVKHLSVPGFSAYGTAPVWVGTRFIIEVPRPGQPGEVEDDHG